MSAMAAHLEIVEDGVTYTVDASTGEVLDAKSEFHVDSAEKAEWVLEKLSDLDASRTALEARRDAVLNNVAIMESRIKAKQNALLFRFQQELQDFAAQNFEKGKKSWVCPHGKISVRTSGEQLFVSDKDKALEWAEKEAPHAVKVTREFQISKLTDADRMNLESDRPDGFDVEPARESWKIETGV